MAIAPFANWKGPIVNKTPGGMIAYYGLILHIESGTEQGTNAWFHDPAAMASAHFGNPKSGPLDQWVDTVDKAWAQKAGNPFWISVEHEGHSGDSLTPSQLENDAQLLAWLHKVHNVALQITDNPSGRGLGWHGMGGYSFGGHYDCPGQPIVNARQAIIDRANQIIGGVITPPTPTPTPQNTETHLILEGKNVMRAIINVTLDNNGNGYADTNYPYDKVLAVSSHAPLYPPRDRRYGKVAIAAQHVEGGNLVVFVQDGEPTIDPKNPVVAPIIVTIAD